MRYVIRDVEATAEDSIGGKAQALRRLLETNCCIPTWFALCSEAFTASLSDEQQSLFQQRRWEALRESQFQLAEAVQQQVTAALRELGSPELLWAVRSSAVDEDNQFQSFAGQLESYLNVPSEEVPAKIAEVWKSAFQSRVLKYRAEHGLTEAPLAPGVLVQRMIAPTHAGVAFAADPVTGQRGVTVVAAVAGLGEGLVSGEVEGNTYRVDRAGKIVRRDLIEDEAAQLSDEQIVEVAQLARTTSAAFGCPQDIEWARDANGLYLLQSRPITSLTSLPDPDGAWCIWDNSNIAESYTGVTTPLTFSFAREIYQEVYLQFCRILKVPESVLAEHRSTFRNMLGLIEGRIYYNLLNWYRMLALLPGFRMNRTFMEQMMGVKEGLPEEIAESLQQSTWATKLTDTLRLLGSTAALVWQHLRLSRSIARFYQRLDTALATPREQLAHWRPDELVAHYRDLQRQLLTRWDAPLVNDFLAMIFFGVLKKLAANWCEDESLTNDLLRQSGEVISAEPARRMKQLAALAAEDPRLVEILREAQPAAVHQALKNYPQFQAAYQQYLQDFGDRCLEELKLESLTLNDNPLPLLRSVANLAGVERSSQVTEPSDTDQLSPQAEAEGQALAALKSSLFRRMMFRWVLKNTRGRVRDRENLRFERTRLFGRIRAIFMELGHRLAAVEVLDDARDVFYLETEEVLGFIEGTSTCTNLQGLVQVRRAEFERYRQQATPADRLETHGTVYVGHDFTAAPLENDTFDGEQLQGIGCCRGVIRGKVKVVLDPRSAVVHPDEILVAQRTDPGWITLMSCAKGLLVERGSLLSHAAIVARELGIPAVVSLPNVTQWLRSGDEVELDGSSGMVRKLNRENT